AHEQNRRFNRIQLFERSVEVWREGGDDRRVLIDASVDELLEVLAVDAGRIVALEKLLLDLLRALTRQLPLIQRLHRQLACDGACTRSACGLVIRWRHWW